MGYLAFRVLHNWPRVWFLIHPCAGTVHSLNESSVILHHSSLCHFRLFTCITDRNWVINSLFPLVGALYHRCGIMSGTLLPHNHSLYFKLQFEVSFPPFMLISPSSERRTHATAQHLQHSPARSQGWCRHCVTRSRTVPSQHQAACLSQQQQSHTGASHTHTHPHTSTHTHTKRDLLLPLPTN